MHLIASYAVQIPSRSAAEVTGDGGINYWRIFFQNSRPRRRFSFSAAATAAAAVAA